MNISLVDTGSTFTQTVGRYLDNLGVSWTLFESIEVASAIGPVDWGVFILPLDDAVDHGAIELFAERVRAQEAHERVFALMDGDGASNVDPSLDDLIDELGDMNSPVTERRLQRFINRHHDEFRADAVKMFLDSSADGYWIWDIADGLVEWSRRTYQILDRTPERAPMTFDAFIEIVHPDDRPVIELALDEHFVHGVAYRNIPMRMSTPYGGYRTLSASGQVVRHPDGSPMLMVGAVSDRSAEITAEQQIEEAQAQYARLFQAMNDAAVLADPMTGLIVDVNEPAERLWARPRNELVGAPQKILHPPDFEDDPDAREVFRRHIRALQEGNRATIEMPILRSDGQQVRVEISSSLFEIDGRQFILGLFRDITERLESEHQLRERDQQLQLASRLAAMGSLAAGVGHEINNPLAYVMGNLKYVRDELAHVSGIDADLMSAIDDAIEGSERVRDIVGDLKTLTRSDDNEETCAPVAVLEIAARMANNELRHRANIHLELEACPNVALSNSRLSQVAVNLLTNAAHSFEKSDPDTNRVEVSLRQAGNFVLLSVKDNGSGIPRELLDKVFDPFFTTKEVVGTGLGLSITRQLIEQAHGGIDIESEVGLGTTVTVRLPVADGTETDPNVETSDTDASPSQNRKQCVMVVDDDERVATAIARVLGRKFDVTTISSASEALAEIERDPNAVDAIICDLMMPVMNGVEFFERLSAFAPTLADRVVFATGGAVTSGTTSFERSMLECGRLVYKPIDVDDITAAFEHLAPAAV